MSPVGKLPAWAMAVCWRNYLLHFRLPVPPSRFRKTPWPRRYPPRRLGFFLFAIGRHGSAENPAADSGSGAGAASLAANHALESYWRAYCLMRRLRFLLRRCSTCSGIGPQPAADLLQPNKACPWTRRRNFGPDCVPDSSAVNYLSNPKTQFTKLNQINKNWVCSFIFHQPIPRPRISPSICSRDSNCTASIPNARAAFT